MVKRAKGPRNADQGEQNHERAVVTRLDVGCHHRHEIAHAHE